MSIPLTRAKAIERLPKLLHKIESKEERLFEELCWRMKEGKVIPIISNSFRLEHIFRGLLDTGDSNCQTVDGQYLNINNLLSQAWAEELNYPLADRCELAHVAQYNQIESDDEELAKVQYLVFLKELLLYLASDAKETPKGLDQQLSSVDRAGITFTELARDLGCPQFNGQEDPLEILAKLPMPVYVTTSCHKFLEEALARYGKDPVTQVCFWSGHVTELKQDYEILNTFTPTVVRPLVYHLYGLEDFPSTLVLSEDDYLRFLSNIKDNRDQDHPLIPGYLTAALKTSSMILLGYRLWDWDFRILFHSLITKLIEQSGPVNLIIQLTPEQQYQIHNAGEAREYLKSYFKPKHFEVVWNSTDQYLCKLRDKWEWWRTEQ